MQTEIQNLLKDVAFNIGTLKEAKKRFADQLAPEFSIFDYFRSDEAALSKCLASLLDPQGSHGQGSLFLKSFCEKLCPNATWIRNFEHCDVVTEKQANGQRRIDIHLTFNEGFIGIENKPWAADQHRQLLDYANHLQESSSGKGWLLLYLCNGSPSEESLPATERKQFEDSNNFIQCNYHELTQWLDDCRDKTKALNVRVFLEDFIKFIRTNINGELEMSEENEVYKAATSSKQNLEAVFDIFRAANEIKGNILKNFRSNLEKNFNSNGFELIWDDRMNDTWPIWSGFGVKFFKNQDLYLRFEFGGEYLNKFFWGIARENSSEKDDTSRCKFVAEQMSSRYGKGKAEASWAWYSTNSKNLFDQEIHNWGDVEFLWNEMIEQEGVRIAQKILDRALEVQEIFSNDLSLLTNK